MKDIEKFYYLKNKFHFKFHGIDMSHAMVIELWELAQGHYRDMGIRGLRWNSRLAFPLGTLSFDPSKNTILSTFGRQNRKDHKEVYDYVQEELGESCSYNDLNKLIPFRSIHNWSTFLSFFHVLRSFFFVRFISLGEKLRFAAMVSVSCNTIYELEKQPLQGVQKYLSMYNSTGLENIITQYMKLKGIPTYSLCEGVYVVEAQNLNYDSVNYRNLETDKLITWGQSVIDDFEKTGIVRERMVVGGYPHRVETKTFTLSPNFKRCMVLLARRTYHKSNIKLLEEMASLSKDYKFCLKCHPDSDVDFYTEFAKMHGMEIVPMLKTVNECLHIELFDWAIAVNTSAYYESLMRGIPCFRYYDGSYNLMHGYDLDAFTNAQQLSESMENVKQKMSLGKYQQDIDNVLKYSVGLGINNYKKILIYGELC